MPLDPYTGTNIIPGTPTAICPNGHLNRADSWAAAGNRCSYPGCGYAGRPVASIGKGAGGSSRVQLIALLVVVLLLGGGGAALYFSQPHSVPYSPSPDRSSQQVDNPPPASTSESAPPTPIIIVVTAPPAAVPTPLVIVITAAAPTLPPAPALPPTATALPDNISTGDLVEVSLNGLIIHTQPGLDAPTVDDSLTRNDLLDVIGGPVNMDGRNWWLVQERYDGGPQGWASALGLRPVDPSVATILTGVTVQVDYEQMNIHDAPDINANILTVVPQGQQLQIVGGPVVVNGRPWWQVTGWDSSGATGWASNRYLRRVY